jgi:HSP20 family protein
MNTNTQPCAKTIRPAASIIHRKDGVIIECDMPGVARDGINLSVENNVLTISGKRAVVATGTAVHREINRSDYRRAFALEKEFDITRISAQLLDGVLRIHLPVAEAPKPRKISVA